MKSKELNSISSAAGGREQMPVLFVGHGSPMNAIEDNEFTAGFRTVAKDLPKPGAILCISAHWETRGTHVTAMEFPRTIHDFGGFPRALYEVRYPAPGSPSLASETKQIITKAEVGLDDSWGLDHGTWSVIRHLYPDADVPVIQMSLDYNRTSRDHYELAKDLASLRQKGVLIIGSGNMVHNLGLVDWRRMNEAGFGFDWALEAGQRMKDLILNDDHESLINYRANGKAFQLAIPTPEHYLPLIYALALKGENEKITLFNDQAVAGSLTMTSIKIDRT
jgi:4,5-DOPA dioxygenase extradiol